MTATEQTFDTSVVADGIILTDGAAAKVKALLEGEGREDLALRVAVQPGGCSGLRYQLFFDDRTFEGDIVKVVWRCGCRDRPDERSVPDGRHYRLRRHHREAGLHHRQPECHGLVRLRRQLPLI